MMCWRVDVFFYHSRMLCCVLFVYAISTNNQGSQLEWTLPPNCLFQISFLKPCWFVYCRRFWRRSRRQLRRQSIRNALYCLYSVTAKKSTIRKWSMARTEHTSRRNGSSESCQAAVVPSSAEFHDSYSFSAAEEVRLKSLSLFLYSVIFAGSCVME